MGREIASKTDLSRQNVVGARTETEAACGGR